MKRKLKPGTKVLLDRHGKLTPVTVVKDDGFAMTVV